MAELSQPVVPPADAATSLHSELDEIKASPADLDPVAESVSLDLPVVSSPSSHVLPVYNPSSSVNDSVFPTGVSIVVKSGSPAAMVASCSSAPPTPQSHGSDNSPGLQQLHSDLAVSMPPPPYSAQGPSADLNAAVTLPVTDSPSHSDAARSHLPPPPKKPLTPYMRFSKSVSDVSVLCGLHVDYRLGM